MGFFTFLFFRFFIFVLFSWLLGIYIKFKDFALNRPEFYIGVVSSFLVGIAVIKFLMQYLKKGSFKIFAIYRVIAGLLIYLIYFIK